MSDGATQNGGTQAATGETAAATFAVVAATATAAPAAQAAATAAVSAATAAPLPAAPAAAVPAAVVVPAAVAVAAPAAAADVDCKPVKKKAHHDHDKKDGEEEHARAPGNDEDQNLSQPADGCVLPQTGEAAPAPAAEAPAGTPVYDDGNGGGISSGLLIGAGVLAAVGVGVLALSKDDKEQNSPPVANADTATVNEGATLNGSVATNDSDPNNDPLTFALTGTAPAGLTFNPNGSFVFDANNAAYNSLAAGATQTLSIPYSVSDGRGGTATSTLTITITGTNDNPVAVNDTAAATEGGAVVTGNVATNDTDADTGQTATLTYTLAAPVAGLTLNTNGTYSFDPTNAAYNSLAAGQTQAVVANVNVRDASGGTTTSTLTITVTGTNDAPVAVNDTAAVNEDATITGNLRTNDSDPDQNAALTYTVVGAVPAGLTVNSNGTYSFNAGDAAYQNLAAGQQRVVTATIAVSDGTAPAVNSTLTITVTGVNDAPVAVADVNAGLEDTQITGSVATNDTDIDTPAAQLAYTVVGSAPAGFTLNANGTYTLDTTNAAYQDLNAGQTRDVVVNYQVADGQGGTAASTLTITVTGVNDGPIVSTVNLDIDDDANLNTVRVFDGAAAATNFTDSAGTANLVVINNFGADDYITFDAAFTGSGRPSFTSGDFDNDSVADDLRITTNINGVLSDIVLTNVVTAGVLVFDEATADAAVFAGADNFRTSATTTTPPPPVGATAQALEADDNTNPNDYRTFDAGTGSFRFTDDADAANNAIIVGLGNNDQIVLEAGNTYSFTSGDRDGDGLANDITVTINKGGVFSELIIKDAVVNNNLVFNEATAEQALGGIDYFSFA